MSLTRLHKMPLNMLLTKRKMLRRRVLKQLHDAILEYVTNGVPEDVARTNSAVSESVI